MAKGSSIIKALLEKEMYGYENISPNIYVFTHCVCL